MRKRPLFLLACVFLTGLAYQRYQMLWLLVVPVAYVVLEIYKGVQNRNYKRMAGRSIILLSAFILGMTHMQTQEAFRDAYMSKLQDGSRTTIWGEIESIETTDNSIRVILTDCYVSLNEENIPCNQVMVYTSSDHFQVGEIYQITGQVYRFSVARNEGNFDSQTFYQSQKIDFYLYEDSHVYLGKKDNVLVEFLLSLKEKMKRVYEASLNEKVSGFFVAMILGNRTNLDETLKDLFTLGGISHILAISGLHVSIIGRGLYKFWRKRKVSFFISGLLASAVLLPYGYMVGNGMSAVRAIGMMLCYFLASYWGRSYDMLNALGGMCLSLLWDNPFLIEYSGFWLSVMALVGVGYVGKNMWMSMGITLATLPVVAFCYYEIPLYSSVVNMIVLPILTPLFCIALIGGVIGCICLPLAKLLLVPCAWCLGFYEGTCRLVEKLPGASIISGCPSMERIVFYYGVLFLAIFVVKHRAVKVRDCVNDKPAKKKQGIDVKQKKREIIWNVGITLLCFGIILFPHEKPFEITFLDVGQGDGIYICDGTGGSYFIDGGSTDVDQLGKYRILPFLKSKGILRIDYWFVSHADTDHISGLLEVLESGYEVNYLVVAKEAPMDENMMTLLRMAEEAQTKVLYMEVGDQVVAETIVFTCLYPWDTEAADRNDSSMVLFFEAKDQKLEALFAGDISAEVERALLSDNRRYTEEQLTISTLLSKVDVYKGIHHGSKYSNSKELLEVLSPEVAVLSYGLGNSYGHPHTEVLERVSGIGCEIRCTVEEGQVTLTNMN